jgi:hypothetical protein
MNEHGKTSKNLIYLGAALVVTLCFFFVELIGSFLTNSLALLTDAWHMLNDAFALALSMIAAWIAQRPEIKGLMAIIERRFWQLFCKEYCCGSLFSMCSLNLLNGFSSLLKS